MWSTSGRYYLENNEFYDFIPVQAIGNGRFGDVFKCFSPSRQHYFALKVAPLDREKPQIGVLPQLNGHLEGTSFIYDVMHGQRTEVIVQELCNTTFSQAKKAMSQGLKLFVLQKIASTLHELHQQNAYHLDIKQNNILLKTSPTGIKVLLNDFGLSQINPQQPKIKRLNDVSSFLRMVFKLAELPSKDYPQQIRNYDQYKKYMEQYLKGKQIKSYWRDIMNFILQPFEIIPSMKSIGKYIKMCSSSLSKINKKKNFEFIDHLFQDKDIVFDQDYLKFNFKQQNHQGENNQLDKAQQPMRINEEDLPIIEEEEEEDQKPCLRKKRGLINKKLPKKIQAADKKRKIRQRDRPLKMLPCGCGKLIRSDNRHHKRTCKEN